MINETIVGQPGRFIVSRPLLAVVLVIAGLALIGFSGGQLVSEAQYAELNKRLPGLLLVSALVFFGSLVPMLSPTVAWARNSLAGAITAVGGLYLYFSMGAGSMVSSISVFLFALSVSLLVLVQPFTGRYLSVCMSTAPLGAMVSSVTFTAFLARRGIEDTATTQLLTLTCVCLAIFLGTICVARFARKVASGMARTLAAGHVVNRMMRDVLYLLICIPVLFHMYLRFDDASTVNAFPLSVLMLAVAAMPVLVIVTTICGYIPLFSGSRASVRLAGQKSLGVCREILRNAPPHILAALGAMILIIAIAFAVDTPLQAIFPMHWQQAAGGGLAQAALVYLWVSIATAIVYLSIRMGALVGITFLISDVLANALQHVMTGGQGAGSLIDLAPRVIVLVSIVVIARNWADILHQREPGRFRIIPSLAVAGPPVVVAILFSVGVFAASGLIRADMATVTVSAAAALMIQSCAVALVLPAAMTILNKMRFDF